MRDFLLTMWSAYVYVSVMRGLHKNADYLWQERMRLLLGAISDLQEKTHSVSLREIAKSTGISRQTIANWLDRAEKLGYVNRHHGTARGTQLLARGKRTLDKLTLQAIRNALPKKAPDAELAGGV